MINVFIKKENIISQYSLKEATNKIESISIATKSIIQLFQQNKVILSDSIQFVLKENTQLNAAIEQQFFKKNIMHFSSSKK
jgi:Holliday junction resolvasome RuvABC endonuclease subunit